MLSPLQERVAALVATLPEAEGFALAGGGALIARGDVPRRTKDLDFFAVEPEAVDRLLPALEAALAAAGLVVERERSSEGFARLNVSGGGEHTVVDLGYDYRFLPAEPSRLGPVLAGEELAGSKLLALFARALARDFVDVHWLSRRYGFDRLCELAAERDRGFDLAMLVDALGVINQIPDRSFELDEGALAELKLEVAGWRAMLTEGLRKDHPGEG